MALRPQPLRLNLNVIASLLPVVVVPFLLAGYAPRSNFAEVATAIVLATAGATSDRSLQQNRHSLQPQILATTLV
jgi:hypothetical protein